MNNERTSLRNFVPYLMQFKLRIIIVFLLLLCAKVAFVAAPIYLKNIVDFLQLSITEFVAWETLLWLILTYFIVRLISLLLDELRGYLFTKVETRVVRLVANDVFKHLHQLSLAFHLNKKMGSVATKIERGVRSIEMVFRFILFNIIPTILELLLVVGVLMYLYDWPFTLITVSALAGYIVFTLIITEARNKVNRQLNKYQNEAQGKAIDSILNYETVKYFTNEQVEQTRYDESLKDVEDTNMRFKGYLYLTNIGQGLIISLGMVLLIYFASVNVLDRTMTIGDFTLVMVYIGHLYTPLSFLGFTYRQVKEGLTNMEDMFSIMDIHREIQDSGEAVEVSSFKKEIAFEHVDFSYNEERQVLHDISFSIPKGQTVALVGPSGSGKSSITRLLFRFYEPQKGCIKIDHQDIQEIKQTSLRSMIGFVPQDTILFNDTIFYNIHYGKPGSTKEEVYEAARKAHIHDFIMTLPQQYETVVGERGLRLSGGEKQRVAIARVILKGAPILVFDEATSSLDSASESIIQKAIKELSGEKTLLIIAHRLSTIIHADNILVMEHGKIKEQGVHKELLKKEGLYAKLWKLQQDERQGKELN